MDTLFLVSVGFWNFFGAGLAGFLINLPVVSYFETGTLLTITHGHAAMMGVFGMLGIALIVFAIRQPATAALWRALEKYSRVGFWGLNIGLMMMAVVLNWHARSLAYTGGDLARFMEWARFPGDVVFIVVGVVPIAIAAVRAYFSERTMVRAA